MTDIQKRKIVFDLAEVLNRGLPGIEVPLAGIFSLPREEILPGIRGRLMDDYCRGLMSEVQYWERTCQKHGWCGDIREAGKATRLNMHERIPGTEEILRELAAAGYETYMLSDHGREWIEYLLGVHDFFRVFTRRFFSFEFGSLKTEQITFRRLISELGSPEPGSVIFIDDNARNIGTAKSVGIDAIQFLDATQLREELAGRSII